MKKIVVCLSLIACALAGNAGVYSNLAGQITGTNSYSAAAYSGYLSVGNYNTAVGNSSFRSSRGNNNTVVGSLAGTLGYGIEHNVFLGNWAGYACTNVVGCVGIGSGALMQYNNATNVTDVNGHFVANGSARQFWITPEARSNGAWDGCPPIFYDNGVLYLNARQIIKRTGVVETYEPLNVGNWTKIDRGLFVATYGDDSNNGTSAYYPKKTLQSALSALTNDTTTIYVAAGTYEAPAYFQQTSSTLPHKVTIEGISDKGEVVIDAGGTGWFDAGTGDDFAEFKNITFTNVFVHAFNNNAHRGGFQMCSFDGCKFAGTMIVRHSCWPFWGCVFNNCEIDLDLASEVTPSTMGYGTVFQQCEMYNTVAKLNVTTGDVNLWYKMYVENCYIDTDKARDFTMRAYQTVLTRRSGFIDTTLLVGSCASYTDYFNASCVTNVLGGITETQKSIGAFSYCGTYSNMVSRIDASTHRTKATDYDTYVVGYGSSTDRALRDGAALYVMNILQATGTLSAAQTNACDTARVALKARATEPSTVTVPTSGVTLTTAEDD